MSGRRGTPRDVAVTGSRHAAGIVVVATAFAITIDTTVFVACVACVTVAVTTADFTVATAAAQMPNANATFVEKGANATGATGRGDFKLMYGDGCVAGREAGRGVSGVAGVRSRKQHSRAEARRRELKGRGARKKGRGRGTGKEGGEGRRLVARRSSGGFSSALRALRVTGSEST